MNNIIMLTEIILLITYLLFTSIVFDCLITETTPTMDCLELYERQILS